MPSSLPPAVNGIMKRHNTSPTKSNLNGSLRSQGSIASSPGSSPEKKSKRHSTVGSLRKLFGNSRASFDSAEGPGTTSDDHTSVKSEERVSTDVFGTPLASTTVNGDTAHPTIPENTTSSEQPAPQSEPPTTITTPTQRETELEQSLSAVQLELQRLQDRVRLLSAENDGYKKEVVDKHIELEERETAVLELKQDVEIEREKVKVMVEKGAVTPEVEQMVSLSGHVGVTLEDVGVLPLPVDELSGSYDTMSSVVSGLPSTKVVVDAGVNTEPEEELVPTELDEEEKIDTVEEEISPELLALQSALDNLQADLTSINQPGKLTLKRRLTKFNELRSRLATLVEQTNLEAVALHRAMDRRALDPLVFIFTLLFAGLIGLVGRVGYERGWLGVLGEYVHGLGFMRYVPLPSKTLYRSGSLTL
ncbi:hypothetical protein NP233_g3017 [Leucocoprinus birnbaumii]|uniref:Uncharacterized protein n=1 Tax=Leucocoprinus birnbaumii TaxID=56174 RepID=A0AAD5VXV6_9AGAR|nr:hypothetical protein NP233_g3017 [Leucocoprinus birnbaumii]